jgi:hypothetical protein
VVYAAWRIADLAGFRVGSQPLPGSAGEITALLPPRARDYVMEQLDNIAANAPSRSRHRVLPYLMPAGNSW